VAEPPTSEPIFATKCCVLRPSATLNWRNQAITLIDPHGANRRVLNERYGDFATVVRPRDPDQLAKLIVDIATGEVADTVSDFKRHLHKRADTTTREQYEGGLALGHTPAVSVP
jgi:hypothetical protein